MGESVEISTKEFTSDFDSEWSAAHLSFYQLHFIDFARWKTN